MSQPNVTVTEVAKSRALCLKADVESELSITAGSDDAKINALIRSAGEYIRTSGELLDGRDPWLQTYLESRPGDGGVYLPLSRWPAKGDLSSVTLGTGASPTTIDSDDYSVAGAARDRIYMAGGWNLSRRGESFGIAVADNRDLDYNITYPAGWVMPDQLSTAWAATTAYAVGDWVQNQSDLDYPLIFECTTAGTSAGSEPAWATLTADGDTVADDTAVWTARDQQLPSALELACKMLVVDWYSGFTPTNVSFEALESWSIRYMHEQRALSASVSALIRAFR